MRRAPGDTRPTIYGAVLRRTRELRGETKAAFARAIGEPWAKVHEWETGAVEPGDAVIRRAAAALHMEPERMVLDALAAELAASPSN